MNLPAQHTGGPLEERRRPGWGLWDWNPFTEVDNPRRDTGRTPGHGATAVWGSGSWVPAVEEDETDDAYVVRAELPGIPRENITVDIDDRDLRISGELTDELKDRVLSRRAGRFFYRTSLPSGVDPEKAEAELTDGVLRVLLPKAGATRRRSIAIGGRG
ncbi:Hsp20/alpha crystallin family protein [Streptomyces deserti]